MKAHKYVGLIMTRYVLPNYTAKGCEPTQTKHNIGVSDVSENTESGRVSIPFQRELEAWQDLAKNFARRLARKDWHRLNSMEILLVEQLEIFGYLEKASGGFVGKQTSI